MTKMAQIMQEALCEFCRIVKLKQNFKKPKKHIFSALKKLDFTLKTKKPDFKQPCDATLGNMHT